MLLLCLVQYLDEHPCQQSHHHMTADEKCRADGQAKSATMFKADLLQRMSESPIENVWQPYFDTDLIDCCTELPVREKVGWAMKANSGNTSRTVPVMNLFAFCILMY